MNEDFVLQAFMKDQHVWKEFLRLVKDFERDVIIETGTYIGQSTIDFCRLGIPVHTTEIRKDYQDKAKERTKEFDNVIYHLGDSAKIVKGLLPTLVNNKPIMFLDSHWYGDNSLENELKTIAWFYNSRPKNKPVLIFHDFKVPDRPEFGHDEFQGRPFEWSWVAPYINRIYGAGHFDHHYNSEICPTASHNRGCLFVTPKQ